MKKFVIGMVVGGVITFSIAFNLGRDVPLLSNPFAGMQRAPSTARVAPTRIWTEAELKTLKGRPVEYFVNVLGKPEYQGKSFVEDAPFLQWRVDVRSELTNEVIRANYTVKFGARRTATDVSIDGGLVQ